MPTERERAIRAAERTSNKLKQLFDRLGNVRHPRGRLLTAYRGARRALRQNTTKPQVVADVLRELRQSVQDTVEGSLTEAFVAGKEQAQDEQNIYGLPLIFLPTLVFVERDVIMATFDAQAAQVRGLALNGDEALILGDAERVGVLSPAPVARETAKWITLTAVGAYMASSRQSVERAGLLDEFVFQAVAVLDSVTTETCQNVNGQRVEIGDPFRLTGTPRFADEMIAPPFHYYCRTTIALVRR